MKKTLIAIAFILACSTAAIGADVNLSWDVEPTATGYKIYQSVDLGQTWDQGLDVGNVIEVLYPDIPDTGIVMFRASAYNEHGEAIRYTAGVWYCGDCTPPETPSGFGIQ